MRKKRIALSSQLAIIVAIVVAAFIVADLGSRIVVCYRLQQEKARLQREVEAEKARQGELEELKLYILSERFVERWAREDAGMVKHGETAIVPVFIPQRTLGFSPGALISQW